MRGSGCQPAIRRVPIMNAQNSRNRSLNIAVIISGVRFDSQACITDGIVQAASVNGDRICLFSGDAWGYSSPSYFNGEMNIYDLIRFERFDGVILHADTLQNQKKSAVLAERIAASRVPAVSLNHRYDGLLYAGIDNASGIVEITEHMIKAHGAHRLNFIAGPEGNYDSAARLQAFRETLRKYRIPLSDKQILHGDYHSESAGEAVRRWLEDDPENMPDVIICANDEMALGASHALMDAGLRVPQDIAVTGFDDAFLGKVDDPTITTVARRDYELGEIALLKLRNHIFGIQDNEPEVLACHTIFRRSCGCSEAAVFADESAERFRKQYVKSRIYMINFTEILKSSAVDFSSASTNEELYAFIRKYVKMMELREFYLCICKKPAFSDDGVPFNDDGENRKAPEYGDVMTPAVSMRDGVEQGYGDFPTEDMFPDGVMETDSRISYLIMPLHYQMLCFGYAIIGLTSLTRENELINLFVLNISNALENVRKQRQLQGMVEKLNRLYIYDSLTEVMNRSGFNRYADAVLKDAAKTGSGSVCIFFADLDNLKVINDTYGHDEGDVFIKTAADVMKKNRHHGELLMRYGGDEFVALVPNITSEEAEARIHKIGRELAERNAADELRRGRIRFDMSIGYIIITPEELRNGIDLDLKIEEADKAMYRVKKKKKDGNAV